MSTDSTELTFVRCPSCRSLVPAVSTRCRMCGAGIDAQGKESSASEPTPPRRTRQNTITQPPTEFVQAVDAYKVTDAESAEPPQMVMDAEEGFDPLRDYLDDTSAEEQPYKAQQSDPVVEVPQSPPAPAPFVQEEQKAVEEDDFDIFSDDDDDWLDDLEDELPVAKEEVLKSTPVKETKDLGQPPLSMHDSENRPREQHKQHDSASNKVAPVTREQPRVVVESGARPGGKPSALSFGKGKSDDVSKSPAQEQNSGPAKTEPHVSNSFARQQNTKQKDNRPQEREQQRYERPRQEQRPQQNPQQAHKREESPVRQSPQGQHVGKQGRDRPEHDRQEHRTEQQQQRGQQVREQKSKVPAHEGVESRLVGWLVSFATPTRNSYELREGKFFVSSSSLKANDLVINDSSIATPHAIVAVESGRLQVQDLMSDAGVFRRRYRESDFAAFSEPFELKHGDWVRFGNIEFLVTMIPTEQE